MAKTQPIGILKNMNMRPAVPSPTKKAGDVLTFHKMKSEMPTQFST